MPCRFEHHRNIHDWDRQSIAVIERCEKLCGFCPTETWRPTPDELFQHVKKAHPDRVVELTPKGEFTMASADKKRIPAKDGGWMKDGESDDSEMEESNHNDDDDDRDDEAMDEDSFESLLAEETTDAQGGDAEKTKQRVEPNAACEYPAFIVQKPDLRPTKRSRTQ